MHLSPVMNIPYIPTSTSTKPASSKPRQRQGDPTPVPVPAPRLVPGERRVKPRLSKPSLDPVLESDQRLSRDVEQMVVAAEVTKVTRKRSLPILPRRRDNFFEEDHISRQTDEPGDRVRNDSVILVEIKTNVIIDDEFTFITELSEYVSLRYNRPASCVVTTLQHGVCMQFGASSEPSYTMKIEALARDVQSAMNKRNIALLQTHMKQALDIPSSRGYVRFVPVTEECTGRKGNTVAGEVAVAMQQAQPSTERRGSIRTPRRRSSKAFQATTETASSTHHDASTGGSTGNTGGSNHSVRNKIEAEEDKSKTVKRRKSFIHALFPRSSSRVADRDTEVEKQ